MRYRLSDTPSFSHYVRPQEDSIKIEVILFPEIVLTFKQESIYLLICTHMRFVWQVGFVLFLNRRKFLQKS